LLLEMVWMSSSGTPSNQVEGEKAARGGESTSRRAGSASTGRLTDSTIIVLDSLTLSALVVSEQ
jgi:hypothetical protein